MNLFPFSEYWWFYGAFMALVLVLLALDLGVFHKKAHEVSVREATIWTVIWISLALLFNVVLYLYTGFKFGDTQGRVTALEFLTGFVVEKSLAIDNLFVFAVVFSFFKIPKIYQHKILFWGILGALVFRAIFIAAGSYLMSYHWVVVFFGGLLILTGIKMVFADEAPKDLEQNWLIRLLRKVLRIHPHIEGPNFWVRKNGVWHATPLFLALVFLEATDIIFAVDSVPAIFALTKEPMIVFTSNIFAILGLRSMYFLLAGVMDRFIYLKYGLAGVLVFVGAKMVYLNEAFGGKFPISWSLAIIALMIGSSIGASWIKEKGVLSYENR